MKRRDARRSQSKLVRRERASAIDRRPVLQSSQSRAMVRLAFRSRGTSLVRLIEEPARSIEVAHETDVLVVGSGPGGLAAALASARAGVETTLIDRYGCFGGNMT